MNINTVKRVIHVLERDIKAGSKSSGDLKEYTVTGFDKKHFTAVSKDGQHKVTFDQITLSGISSTPGIIYSAYLDTEEYNLVKSMRDEKIAILEELQEKLKRLPLAELRRVKEWFEGNK